MDATIETQDWKTRAAQQSKARIEDNAEAEAERAATFNRQMCESHRKHLRNLVGPDADRAVISEDGKSSVLDGVEFWLDKDYDLHAVILCDQCHGRRYSYPLNELASLGDWLDDHEGLYHECQPNRPTRTTPKAHKPTDAERALALFRELVDLVHTHEQES